MNNIFVNQDWTIILDVGIDISTAPVLRIIYRKPNSATEVEVNATLYTSTSIYYYIPDTTNNADGQWLFRAKITDITGKILFGEPVRVDIKKAWFPYA
jgi:hypothetical protein